MGSANYFSKFIIFCLGNELIDMNTMEENAKKILQELPDEEEKIDLNITPLAAQQNAQHNTQEKFNQEMEQQYEEEQQEETGSKEQKESRWKWLWGQMPEK
jgi:hypothetical protein